MLQRVLREPLLYFLLVGGLLFVLADRFGGDELRRIAVTEIERNRLADQWQAQMGRPPTDAELEALVEQWIREEIYYREALAMGLDAHDVIVRRRLVQKLTFLTEDLATAEPPDETILRRYHQRHLDRYAEPARFSFVHRYFSGDLRPDAEDDARAALDALNASEGSAEAIPEGDPFILQRGYLERSRQQIGELFGREFAAALVDLRTGTWHGPIASAYGWHLVKVEQRRPGRPLGYDEVATRVANDYRQQQRREANERFYRTLRSRYQVTAQ
jgi:peptidyl-prolyl cis-trans isomerase C